MGLGKFYKKWGIYTLMSIAIKGVWKGGKIMPLEEIEVEEDTPVDIHIPTSKKKRNISALAGAWKDYQTPDGKNLDDIKKEIYDSRSISHRRAVRL